MKQIEKLEAKNIGKRYGGSVALNDISCAFEKGMVYGIVGENGAGKSTLVKIINGTVIPDEGQLFLNGEEIRLTSPSMAAEMGIGMVYQELNLLPNMSVMENVFISHLIKTKIGYIDMQQIKRETQKYLDLFKLDIQPTDLVGGLKAAHQQIVAIIRAYAMNCSLIILDEPTSALPMKEIGIVLDVVRKLKELGCIVLYISHKLSEVISVTDRLVALRNGKLVGTYASSEFDKDRLAELIAGRKLEQKFPKQDFVRGEELLRLEHVSVPGYLNDISFTLYRGEILGFAGLLGAGKTEIAKTIFGVFGNEYTGSVYLHGQKIKANSPMAALKKKIGLVPENRGAEGLLHHESIKMNMLFAALQKYSRNGYMKNKPMTEGVNELVKMLGVKCGSVEDNIMSLSGGNQQKVVLSKWMAADSEVIIFDEPTRGIDVGAKEEIYLLMNKLVERGVGVMIMSSENDEVMNMCDRVILLEDGSIVDVLDTKEHKEEDLDAMLV